MSFQLAGIAIVALFYATFFLIGARAGRATRGGADEFLLAGRRLPLWIGVLTMVATWVGGGFVNGTAEAVYDPARGLVWAQAPWGYALSLILGGLIFAAPMRRSGYRTLLDPFQQRYGARVAALLYLPALLGEIFWSAAILVALGTTFGVILGFDFGASILISAAVAVGYTMLGGLRSVAYTDALQLAFILAGLLVALPFVLDRAGGVEVALASYGESHGAAAALWPSASSWSGGRPWGWLWADSALLLVLGGIPWQVYFQRVLACPDERRAVRLSVAAGFGCLLMALPAAWIGLAAAGADWAGLGLEAPHPALALPYALRYLTPPPVAVIGLAAVAAAVMSSVDSSILSASSMFAWNVYRPFRGLAGDDPALPRVSRLAVLAAGTLAALLALQVQSVYSLWFLCSDLVYVLLLPQLVMALFYSRTTRAGALAGAGVGLLLRAGGGEPVLGLPPLLPYPWQDPEMGILFPFRTFAMLSSLAAIALVSAWTRPSPGEGEA